MRATYLTGEHIYLRSMQMSDKDQAPAWFPHPYPVNSPKAEEFLKESHKDLNSRKYYLAIVRREGDEVVGSVFVWTDLRHGRVRMRTAPWLADGSFVRGETVRLVVPWLRDEAELITVTVELAADDDAAIAVAEELGMIPAVRLRQWYARPGKRVDQILYQALNPRFSEGKKGATSA